MTQVEVDQVQDHLLELIERALRGEDVVIVRDSQPLVRLTPVGMRPATRHFGSAEGLIHIGEDFDAPLPEFKEYS